MLVFVVFFVTLAGALLPPFALKEIAYVYFVAAGTAAENKVTRRMMERIRDNIRCCFFMSFDSPFGDKYYSTDYTTVAGINASNQKLMETVSGILYLRHRLMLDYILGIQYNFVDVIVQYWRY